MKMKKKFEDYWENYINRDLKYKFIKRVKEGDKELGKFRCLWDIPPNGFETKKEAKEWDRKQKKNSEHKAFRVSLQEEELRYMTYGFELYKPVSSKTEEQWERQTEVIGGFEARFHIAVRKLIKQLKIDPLWYHPFVNYILLGKINMSQVVSAGIQVSERVLRDNKGEEIERNICFTFGPNTRIEDIQNIWSPQVKKLQKALPGYFRKNLRITKKMAKKYKLGKYS